MRNMAALKYNKEDVVTFRFHEVIKKGTIIIVDASRTFFRREEPSYDIQVMDVVSG